MVCGSGQQMIAGKKTVNPKLNQQRELRESHKQPFYEPRNFVLFIDGVKERRVNSVFCADVTEEVKVIELCAWDWRELSCYLRIEIIKIINYLRLQVQQIISHSSCSFTLWLVLVVT